MHDRQAYVVMELLTGQTLRERLAGSSRQSGTAAEGAPSASPSSATSSGLALRTWRADGRESVYSYRRELCQLFSVSGVGR